MHRTLAYFLLFLLLIGCNKTKPVGETKATTNYEVSIISKQTATTIHVLLYSNQEDYMYSRNAVQSVTLEGYDDIVKLNLTDLNAIYHIDVFSDNKSISNWGVDLNTLERVELAHKFKIDPRFERVITLDNKFLAGDIRKAFIRWNEPETKWKAIGHLAYNGTSFVSDWSTLPDTKKHLNITLKKNFGFTLERKTADGHIETIESNFEFNRDILANSGYALLKMPEPDSIWTMQRTAKSKFGFTDTLKLYTGKEWYTMLYQ